MRVALFALCLLLAGCTMHHLPADRTRYVEAPR